MTGVPRWRTNYCCVAKDGFLVVLALSVLVRGVFARTILSSREISSRDESSVKSREITIPDEIRRRCKPVSHDVLWIRLNIAPRLPASNVADIDQPSTADQQQPETETDFDYFRLRHQRRYRRETQQHTNVLNVFPFCIRAINYF